jgi:predicted adenylyl cyclase CyaB
MTFEVEAKAWVADPAGLEERAKELGRLKKESTKEDVYYRRKGETSAVPLDRFRLRREAGQAVVTYKEKIVADGTEVNDEVEYIVDQPFSVLPTALALSRLWSSAKNRGYTRWGGPRWS